MSTLTTYVWKEWRDHRTTVFGILGVQVLVSVCLVIFLRDTVFGSTAMISAVSLGSIALTLVAFGPELVAGEGQSGTLGFLCRMPCGLRWAFSAKVLFLLGALACLCCTGYSISSTFRLLAVPSWALPDPRLLSLLVPGAVTLGLLLMAVSSWLPCSILTIPATALLILVLLIPCYLILGNDLGLARYLRLEKVLVWAPFLALGVFWISLTGRRAGGGPGSSALRGLVACILATVPLWSWVGSSVHRWGTLSAEEGVMIGETFMGAGGRYAFVNVTGSRMSRPWMGAVVDLETGSWRRLGKLDQGFVQVGWNERFLIRSQGGEHTMVALLPVADGQGYERFWYVDGRTGEIVHEALMETPYADFLDEVREARRSASPARTPDGRKVWMFRGKLEMDAGNGVFGNQGFEELRWDRRDAVHSVVGWGLSTYRQDMELTVYDLTRGRTFEGLRFLRQCCWVLGDLWLVGDRERTLTPPTLGTHFSDWRLLDPDTGEEQVAEGMMDGDRVVTILDDGRAVVQHEDKDAGTTWMFAGDPISGARQSLTVQDVEISGLSLSERNPVRTADGRRLFYARFGGLDLYLTSLAPGSTTLTPPAPMSEVVGCSDDTTALIISADRCRLERVDLLTGERTTVFPR